MVPLARDEPRILGPIPGPRSEAWLERDDRVLSPSYTRTYPLAVKRAKGAMIEDMDGNRFLDFTAGIAVTNVGHSHPAVVKAMIRQSKRLIHMSGTDFYYAPQIRLAERLAEIAPGSSRKRVFYTNSGAESVEAALKLSRKHTGRPRVVAFLRSFHGRTYGAMSLSASKPLHRMGFAPLVADIHHATYNDLESVKQLFKTVCAPEETAAIFVEPIQGEGGYIIPDAGFLVGLRQICDKHGILLVADEVQTGFGRTGKMFACEHWGVEPDVVCLAKGIANGLPLGAIVAKADVMDWPSGSHASTFGGNPVACAAALASIKLLQAKYIRNAEERGRQLIEGLKTLVQAVPIVREVRGKGLMIGMEIQSKSREPAPGLRDQIIDAAFYRGLLLLPCGPSTVRYCPPLCLTERQVEIGLKLTAEALNDVRTADDAGA